MAEDYKRLGAVAPTDSNEHVLYVAPSATESLVSNITVTNRSASAQTFDVNIYETGVVDDSDVNDVTTTTFIAVSSNTSAAVYSSDSITWTQNTMPSSNWQQVGYGDGTYVAIGSTKAATSTDAITWTQHDSAFSTGAFSKLAYGGGVFVSVSEYGDRAIRSTDGVTWTDESLPSGFMNYWVSIAYGSGTFVAITRGYYGATSTDGVTWTSRYTPIISSYWDSVTYGNGTFVMTSGYAYAAYSTDSGANWTQSTLPFSNGNSSVPVVYGNNIFLAFGEGTTNAATSTDGISWTIRTKPQSATRVTYGDGKFVSVGHVNSNQAYSSTDAITWTQYTLPVTDWWSSISYGEDVVAYITPDKNKLYVQSDIAANSTEVLEPGITLSAEGAIAVKDNGGGNLTFSTYGVELS